MSTYADSTNGLNIPFGMTYTWNATLNQYMFVLGNTDEVRSYSVEQAQRTQLVGRGKQLTQLPGILQIYILYKHSIGGGYNQHWTRNVIRSPNWDKLYVSVGSRTNVDIEEDPRASILVMNNGN
jgi:glucose/arabinose dehydrogenase